MSSTVDSRPWVSVGFAAWPENIFLEAKKEICAEPAQEGAVRLKVFDFLSSPMDAIVDDRKKAVRQLGGTLSDTDQIRRYVLKGIRSGEMEGALMSPNFMVFELKTRVNIPDAISKGLLNLLGDKPTNYRLGLQQALSPFKPRGSLHFPQEDWKIETTSLDLAFFEIKPNYLFEHIWGHSWKK